MEERGEQPPPVPFPDVWPAINRARLSIARDLSVQICRRTLEHVVSVTQPARTAAKLLKGARVRLSRHARAILNARAPPQTCQSQRDVRHFVLSSCSCLPGGAQSSWVRTTQPAPKYRNVLTRARDSTHRAARVPGGCWRRAHRAASHRHLHRFAPWLADEAAAAAVDAPDDAEPGTRSRVRGRRVCGCRCGCTRSADKPSKAGSVRHAGGANGGRHCGRRICDDRHRRLGG